MPTTNPVPTAVYYRSPRKKEQSTPNENQWRNQPQSNAMASGAMLFIAGGMEMALGLGWNTNTYILTTMPFQFCWFLGVIVGAVLAAPLIPYLQKRLYIFISALLVLASGIIFVSVPYNYDAIIAARCVNGVGIGFSLVAFIVHGGEIGAPSYRGSVLALEQYAFTLGIAIQVIYASQWTPYTDFAANRLHGIFLIVFAVVAMCAIYFIIESPIFYIRKSDDNRALECLSQLERPQIITESTKAQLQELKNYFVQEDNQSIGESVRKAFQPYVKMMLYRSMVALSFTLPLTGAIEVSSFVSMGYANSWPPIVYAALRVLGAFIAIWLVDGLGRKLVSLFALLCMAGLVIGVGIIYSNNENLYDTYQMSISCTLLMIMQFFGGLFSPSSSAYLGEAYPLMLKPYLVAICVSFEQVIHIITIVSFVFTMYNEYSYCIAVGVIMFILFVLFCLIMPETRSTTLREAQNRFRYVMYLKMY